MHYNKQKALRGMGRHSSLWLKKLQKIPDNLLDKLGIPYSFFLVPPGRFLRWNFFRREDETTKGLANSIQQQDDIALEMKRTVQNSRFVEAEGSWQPGRKGYSDNSEGRWQYWNTMKTPSGFLNTEFKVLGAFMRMFLIIWCGRNSFWRFYLKTIPFLI